MGRKAITPDNYRGYVAHLSRLIEATENDVRYPLEWRDAIRLGANELIRGLMMEPEEKKTANAKR